jgi:hypothetical protein
MTLAPLRIDTPLIRTLPMFCECMQFIWAHTVSLVFVVRFGWLSESVQSQSALVGCDSDESARAAASRRSAVRCQCGVFAQLLSATLGLGADLAGVASGEPLRRCACGCAVTHAGENTRAAQRMTLRTLPSVNLSI